MQAQAEMAITLKAENARLAASNAELKAQVDVYASKLDEFQGTLAASNKVFGDIKADMEAHSKASFKKSKTSCVSNVCCL